MKDEVKQAAEVIVNHPKTAVAVGSLAQINAWWMEWGSPITQMVTSILGVILLIVLIRKHWHDGSAKKNESK